METNSSDKLCVILPLQLACCQGLHQNATSNMKYKLLWVVFSGLWPAALMAQEAIVDTTSADYRLGRQIGSWIPFVVLATLFLLMWRAAMRRGADNHGAKPLDD